MRKRPTVGRLAIVLASLAIVLVDLATAAHCSTARPPAGADAPAGPPTETATPVRPPAPTAVVPATASTAAPDRLLLPAIAVDARPEALGTMPQTREVPRRPS